MCAFYMFYSTRNTYTHLTALFSGTTWVSRYQKGKTNLDFTEARDSGISWAVCKSVFYRPDALPATQPIASKH